MDQSFMKERPIFRLMLAMSVPNMLSMLVNSLYNIVDSLFVAHISEEAMMAISLVFPISNIIIALSVGFGIGMNAMVAFFLGKKELDNANTVVSTGLVLSALHGLLLSVIGILAMPSFLRLFCEDEQVIQMGIEYSNIVLSFSIPYTVSIAMEKLFQSVGRMKTSMMVMIVGCLTNIILDPILIFKANMGIRGAAIATGIGQVLSTVLYIIMYLLNRGNIKVGIRYIHFKPEILKELYMIGIPASLNIALPSLLISFLNKVLAAYSEIYIVVIGIYYKLQTFVYLPANGIIQGVRPLVGYNFGAKEYDRVKKIYRVALSMTAVIMLAGTLVCTLFSRQLISMFTTNPETIEAGIIALRTISMGFIVSTITITSSGALEGLGMGMPSLVLSLMRFIFVMMPVTLILNGIFGVKGIWNSFWVTELLVAVFSFWLYHKSFENKVLSQS